MLFLDKNKTKELLFVLGGGIGNIIQATPTIQSISSEGWKVDLMIHCNSTSDLDIFEIPDVRKIYSNPPKNKYTFQLNGPFTPRKKYIAQKQLFSRINYAANAPEVNVYYDLAVQMGIKTPIGQPKINVGLIGPSPVSDNTVAIYPGSKFNWPMKRWDKYDQLAACFNDVIIVGTHKDVHEHGEPSWIHTKWCWPKNVKFFQGSLQQTAYLISKCKMFIGNDGGLAHVAAATGIPTYILFGPSCEIKNKPHSSNSHVIAIDLACRPCQFSVYKGKQIFDGDIANCWNSMKCMRDMSAEYVLNKINR